MRRARSLLLFVMAVVAAFVYLCNAIPQIKSEPVAAEMRIGESPEELVAAGKRTFMSDRAQCITCHSLGEDPKARCPNQEGLGERAPNRKPGLGAAEYLVESVYNPNAFVVPGYPKNQMTPANKPPIALSHDEILAVIAFLNTLGGNTDVEFISRVKTAQEPWRKGLLTPEERMEGAKLPILPGDVDRGRDLFDQWGCIQCHRVRTDGSDIGPDLNAIGASQTAEYILESILDPNAVIVRGYKPTIVMWKEPGRGEVRGKLGAWIPDKEHPRALRLSGVEGGETVDWEIDLSQVAYVGDTTVGVKVDGEVEALCGEYVEGDKKTGLTLTLLQEGQWVRRRIPPNRIEFVNLPLSPMPSGYADMMTPREAYDLVAYLAAEKGEK